MSQFKPKKLAEKMFQKVISVSNMILLILVFIFIFVLSFLPETIHPPVQRSLFSLIFITSVFALETNRKIIITIAVIAFISEWLTSLAISQFCIIFPWRQT